MTDEDMLIQLSNLYEHCNTMSDEPGDVWTKDCEAINMAIRYYKKYKALTEKE